MRMVAGALAGIFGVALAAGQVTTIIIKAGSPQDLALQQISGEADAGKRIELYKDFVQKFASDPDATAYGEWQIAQTLAAQNQFAESLEWGDKALALEPHNLEIICTQAGNAQQLKQNAKVFEYAMAGGAAYGGIGRDPKPANMSDLQYEMANAEERRVNQPSNEYLQALAYNVIAAEPDARKRMSYIQKFNDAFPDSKYQDQVSEFAILTLQSLQDTSNAIAYGEAVLYQNPKNLPTLVLMAHAYAQSGKAGDWQKGINFAQQALALAKADDPAADTSRKLSAGFAYGAMGSALIKQKREAAAVPELRHGISLLKENRAAAAPLQFELGRAYAILRRYEEAKPVLTEAASVPGPAQAAARDLLNKIVEARH